MARHRISLEILEKQLSDETLYADPARKDELADMVRKQGVLKKELEDLEYAWLDASESLESAQNGNGMKDAE